MEEQRKTGVVPEGLDQGKSYLSEPFVPPQGGSPFYSPLRVWESVWTLVFENMPVGSK